MTIRQRFQNLVAVPSYHFDPVFAQEVRRVFASERPAAVALELLPGWEGELQWAASAWPTPVASHSGRHFLPLVPGDSMVEAWRLAREAGVPVFFVDRLVAGDVERPEAPLPDSAFAERVGALFVPTVDALQVAAGEPAAADLAREAHMARQVSSLMVTHERVLWVGGLAHWSRMLDRLRRRDWTAARVPWGRRPQRFARYRLDASALHRMTAQVPFSVARYAEDPDGYAALASLHALALDAAPPELIAASDIAAMLRYARNLAAQDGLRETPGAWNLLTAASACLGNEFAARLARLALRDEVSDGAATLPTLSWGVASSGDRRLAFRSGRRVVKGEALLVATGDSSRLVAVPTPAEIDRRERARNGPDVSPAGPKEREVWAGFPNDDAAYEAFVRFVLERCTGSEPDLDVARPFSSGMGEGIDLRATLRHWHTGDIYVRERSRTRVRVANGLIDWNSRDEARWDATATVERREPYWDGDDHGGWIDPSLHNVGSASWQYRKLRVLQSQPFHIQENDRELTLISLDMITSPPSESVPCFYDRVIQPLVGLPRREQTLSSWLRVMFRACQGKPFAYFSWYVPSPRIMALAREHDVHVQHVPLARVPRHLLDRHRSFRFMSLTRTQWASLMDPASDLRTAWVPSAAGL